MVARAKAKRWLKLIAGLALGATGAAAALGAADGLVPAAHSGVPRAESRRVAPLQGRPSQARAALTGALESQRRGDYQTAAGLLQLAQERQADLSATELQELAALTEANAQALFARRLATEQLRQAESMTASGQAGAADLLKKVLANEQYLLVEDRQMLAALTSKPVIRQTAVSVQQLNVPEADLARLESQRPTTGSAVKPAALAPADKPAAAGKNARISKDQAVAMLHTARALLNENKIEEATVTAQKVKTMTALRWGLFEDNPEKVLQDIQKSRLGRDREESVKVLAEARRKFDAKDFQEASRLAYKAQTLHGPYSIWDLGDRPHKLLAEIDTAKTKAGKTSVPGRAQAASRGKDTPKAETEAKPVAMGIKPRPETPGNLPGSPDKNPAGQDGSPATLPQSVAGAVHPLPPANPLLEPSTGPINRGMPTADANTVRARPLLAQARALQAEGKLLEARQAALQAQQCKASFGPDEDSPERALLQLSAAARQKVNVMVSKAFDEASYGKGDPVLRAQEAEKQMVQARAMAAGFGQDVYPIDSKIAEVRQLRGGLQLVSTLPALPGASHSGVAALPLGVPKQSLGTRIKSPTNPNKANPTAQPLNPAATPPSNLAAHGRDLLDKSRLELTRGELSTARRLAQEAYTGPYGVQDQAVAVLRSIDAEEANQRLLQAQRTFDAAQAAFNRREYAQSRSLLQAMDARQLDARRQNRLKEILNTPEMQPSAGLKPEREPRVAEAGSGLVPVTPAVPGTVTPVSGNAAGKARASDGPGEKNSLATSDAMRNVAFQKWRADGMECQKDAAEKLRTGQTDAALDVLQKFLGDLADSHLDTKQVGLLKRPVEARLEQYRLLKAQIDFQRNDAKATANAKEAVKGRFKAEEKKQKNVAELMKQFNTLFREAKYVEAEHYAMLAHELDPDNPMAAAAVQIAKMQRNVNAAKTLKQRKADTVLEGLNDAENPGDAASAIREGGMAFSKDGWDRAKGRKPYLQIGMRRSEKELQIESKLNSPVTMNFTQTPLYQVIEDLRLWQNLNIYVDEPALQSEGISLDRPVSVKFEQVSLKSALNLLLHGLNLTYVIKEEVLQITTEKEARGKNQTVTYQVADLVLPIENFGDIRGVAGPTNLHTALTAPAQRPGGPIPYNGSNTLPYGQPTGSPGGSGGSPFGGGDNKDSGWKKGNGQTTEDTLIHLITSTVDPRSWAAMGGPGTIEFFPYTMALVINQTPDIQEQVADLLQALRRLQDQEVAMEVRLISIADDFFERIGVNFNLNVLTHNRRYEPQITTGQFQADNFINNFTPNRFLAGLSPTNTFTADLNIPITTQTFAQAIPPFGGYNGIPGYGGLTLGLGFLSDIQVFLFMEAVQGDKRTNVMQAPKLTMFNGQTASLNVNDFQFFVTSVNVQNQQGQFTFQAQNIPFPIGTNLTLQPVISADRRFVRLSSAINLTNLASPNVNLFPIVTPIFPLLDGGFTGQPVVFTQFIQQPVITSVGVQTTVNVPDGGTVLMGGLKRLSEGRNEYGPPVLSKIPYINRLFKNVGYGREAHSLLIMVSPRIIIMEEEEERQTSYRAPVATGP